MIPFEQMTLEDFIETFPNDALDCHNRPTFWPHTISEQLVMVTSSKKLIPKRPIVVAMDTTRIENELVQHRNEEILWKLG